MKVYRDLASIEISNHTACGIGNFDGVHLGHQKLVETILECSKTKRLDSLIFTFDPHPSTIINPNNGTKLIMSNSKKQKIMESYGIDHFVLAPFTHEFSKMDYKDFVYNILIEKCRAKVIVIGFNYRFGYKGMGTAESLMHLCNQVGVETVIIPPVTYEGNIVSSTYIRKLLEKGDVKSASKLLGRPFTIEGQVIQGRGLGKRLGFPTANLSLDKDLVLPARGVYAVLVSWKDSIYKGIANLGIRPTFNGDVIAFEIHLFDFGGNLYGEKLEVSFVQMLRPETKFTSTDDLVRQVQKDMLCAREILNTI